MYTTRISSRLTSLSQCIFRGYGTRQESRQWRQRPNRKPRLTLILSESVPNLGSKGEMVHVKRGYGRNFLLPKGKAVYATQDNMKLYDTVEKRLFIPKRGTSKVKLTQRDTTTKEFLITFLKDKKIKIEQDETVENWCLYEFQVAEALHKQLQCHAPLDCIEFPRSINSFGSGEITLIVDEDTRLNIPVDVVPLPEHKRKPSRLEEEKQEDAVNN